MHGLALDDTEWFCSIQPNLIYIELKLNEEKGDKLQFQMQVNIYKAFLPRSMQFCIKKE